MTELKGYNYKEITLGNLKKYKVSAQLEGRVTQEGLKEKCETALKEKGKVYFVTKKKAVYGLAIFKYELYQAKDFELKKETFADLDENESIPSLELTELILTDELQNRDKLIMFDVIDYLKSSIFFYELPVKAIIWGEEVVARENLKKDGAQFSITGLSIGLSLGLVFGLVIFHNVGVGLCFGLAFGMCFNSVKYVSAKKKQ